MRWSFSTCALLGAFVLSTSVSASPDFSIDTKALSTWFTPPLRPDMEAAGSDDLFPMSDCWGFQLEEATIDEMQKAMDDGKLTSVQLVLCYMMRAHQTQQYINSIQQFNPDAIAIAATMDLERSQGKVRGPLHGIPFTVKDNFATLDNMEATAGSWALLGAIPPRDAHAVKKLRDAGAVLFGKNTCSEWADMRSNDYSEGYSARGGQTRSSYNFTVNPGGSSGGSAISVSNNVIAFSLGTETDGSVINPAMRNAVVGFKPTVGLTSRAGVIPESEHQDSVGTFGRTARDAIYALDAIYGVDKNDNYTSAQKCHTPKDGYVPHLADKSALKGAKFGLPWMSFWQYAPEAQVATLLEIIKLIEDAGAEVVNGTEITDYETIVSPDGWNWDYGSTRGYPNESEYTVVKVDFYNNINKYLSELENTNIRTIDDIIQFNYDNDGSEGGHPDVHPAFASGQDGFLASQETKGEYDETYWQALGFVQSSTRNGINDALRLDSGPSKKLDGLLVPPDVGQSGQIAAQAGYPMMTVPAGEDEESGMPFGLALIQTAWGEKELVKYGSAIEDLLKGTEYGRKRATWRGYLERNLPVPF